MMDKRITIISALFLLSFCSNAQICTDHTVSDVTDVSYTDVSSSKTLSVKTSVSLPATNKTLTVTSAGDYNINAGTSIKLKKGFKVSYGGKLHVKRKTCQACDPNQEIEIVEKNESRRLSFYAKNANTYLLRSSERGSTITRVGLDGDVYHDEWTTTYLSESDDFLDYVLVLYNECGGSKETTGTLLPYNYPYKSGSSAVEIEGLIEESANADISITVSPNPTNGIVAVDGIPENFTITVINNLGVEVLSKQAMGKTAIDLSAQPKGIYVLTVSTTEKTFTEKVMLK